jgi:hypothetical protein
MNIQELNARDIGKLKFDYNITFHPKSIIYSKSWESQIEYICKDTNYQYLYYSWERSRETNSYHAHILFKSSGLNILSFYSNINGYNDIEYSNRKTIVKTKKQDIGNHKHKGCSDYIDIPTSVSHISMYGKIGKVQIEPIINDMSSVRYTTKYTSYGLNAGYIQG